MSKLIRYEFSARDHHCLLTTMNYIQQKLSLTQTGIARKLNVTQTVISQYRCQRIPLNVGIFIALAELSKQPLARINPHLDKYLKSL